MGELTAVDAVIHFAPCPVPTATGLASLDRIAELAQTLAPLLEDAAYAGARKSPGLEFAGRGQGFTDAEPTGTAALDPTRHQMRAAVRRAVGLILRAEDELAEVGAVICVVEKRRAALQDH